MTAGISVEIDRKLIVRRLRKQEIKDAGRLLAASMMVEPGYVSIMPDDELRWSVLVPLITGTVREAMMHEVGFGAFAGDHLLGVSLWLPPGLYPPPPAPDNAPPPQLPPYLRDLDPDILMGLIVYDDRCMKHFPDEPAWYLMYLGVDPAGQGRGVGSSLLRESMAAILQRQLAPLYLETGTERNVRFYERFGFRVREANVHLVSGDTLHWTMLHPAPVGTPG